MPSPGTAISELIALNLVSVIGGITAGATYTNTVAECVRPNPGLGTPTKDNQVIVVQGKAQFVETRSQQHHEWLLPFELHCTVLETESTQGTVAIDSILNSLVADILRVLMVDRQRGGNAINTEFVDVDPYPIEPNAREGGAVIHINVRYRTLAANPYSL